MQHLQFGKHWGLLWVSEKGLGNKLKQYAFNQDKTLKLTTCTCQLVTGQYRFFKLEELDDG